jgi:hypothetical protein
MVHFQALRHWSCMKLSQTARSRRASASFRSLWLLAVAGTMTVAACGDDGNLLGSDGSAGKAGSASAGSLSGTGDVGIQAGSGNGGNANSGGTAGTAANGGNANGGTASGGTATNGGTANGGAAACNMGQCIRANVCFDECDGNVVYTGCCGCPAGTVEQLSCTSSGGQGSGGQASGECVGTTCTAAQTCVAYRTVGGAIFPPDAQGMCMEGRHVEGQSCQADFGYTCAELTGCDASGAKCRCAANTECANTTDCRAPTASAWLDASAHLVCELLAP